MTPLAAFALVALAFAAQTGAEPEPAAAQHAAATAEFLDAAARADSVEILSLDPELEHESWKEQPCADACYYRWPVVGAARVDSAAERAAIVAELHRWAAAPHPGYETLCFVPHHGIRIRRGERTYDVVACYECAGLRIYRDGHTREEWLSFPHPNESESAPLDARKDLRGFPSPKDSAALDAILRAHGLPVHVPEPTAP